MSFPLLSSLIKTKRLMVVIGTALAVVISSYPLSSNARPPSINEVDAPKKADAADEAALPVVEMPFEAPTGIGCYDGEQVPPNVGDANWDFMLSLDEMLNFISYCNAMCGTDYYFENGVVVDSNGQALLNLVSCGLEE